MEINKQLFEDVLCGKLNGTFVLRNGGMVETRLLERTKCESYPYSFHLRTILYDVEGHADKLSYGSPNYDIVDFTQDTK